MNREDLEKIAVSVAKSVLEAKALPKMSLALAKKIIARVEEEAARVGVNAVIAIADKGANTVAVVSMDDAYIASYDIAVNKAYTSAALKMKTVELSKLAAPGGPLYGIQHTNGGRIVIFGGGEPLYVGGELIGAIGVSGGTEPQDTALGAFGAKICEEEARG